MDIVPILPGYADKVGTLKVTLQDIRDAECADYAHYMQKMLEFSEAQKIENRKLAEIRKKRYGIDPHAQQPSTLAIMARPKEEDEAHFFRPLPKEVIEASKVLAQAVANGDETKIKELVAEREVTEKEVAIQESIRRAPKNETGQSTKSATGEEQKTRAEEAFLYSPGIQLKNMTEEDKQRIVASYGPDFGKTPKFLNLEKDLTDLIELRLGLPSTLASRFKHWLWKKGFPIQRLTKDEFTVEEADK